MTENHDLNAPRKGTNDWHIPLNNNFKKLDAKLEIRDQESNRGDYRPVAGAKFFATDTANEYLGDGSQWVEVPSSGKDPSFDSVRARRYLPDLESQTQVARNDRPMFSTVDRTVYVDPDDGDDGVPTARVTQDNPLRTLSEALFRVPFVVQHEWVIKLANGTYDSSSAMNGPTMNFSTWNTPGVIPAFRIEGDQSTPSNVVIDTNYFNLHTHNAETDDSPDAVLSGLQFEGNINNKGGLLSVANCRFTGNRNSGGAILGKAGGRTQFHNCTFEPGLDHVVNLSNVGAEAVLSNCQGRVSEYVYDLEAGAKAFHNGGNSISADLGLYTIGSGGVLFYNNGTALPNDRQIVDDFDDGRLFGGRITDNRFVYRPEWEDRRGNVTATDGVMRLPEGDSGRQHVRNRDVWNVISEIVFDFRFESEPSTGSLQFAFHHTRLDRDRWAVTVDNGGSYRLDKTDGGSDTNGVVSGSWPGDTRWHTARVTRGEDGSWELFLDGSSVGTASDGYLKSPLTSRTSVVNDADSVALVDNLLVK